MYRVEADPGKQVFVITAAGHVTAPEITAGARELETLLEDAEPGFIVLADFRRLESMKPETAQQIGVVMDQFAKKEVAAVIRIVPDRYKDVGLNILSQIHYPSTVEIATVPTLAEAVALLLDAA